MKKKIFSFILALVTCFTVTAPVFAADSQIVGEEESENSTVVFEEAYAENPEDTSGEVTEEENHPFEDVEPAETEAVNEFALDSAEDQASPSGIVLADIPNMSLTELQDAAKQAVTDEEATAVFNELIKHYPSDEEMLLNANGISPASVTSTVVSQYLSVTSTSVSGQTLKVNYKIIAKVPSNVPLKLGYEYPATYRTSGADTSLAGKAIGSYTANLALKNLLGYYRVYGRIIAGGYTYTNVYKTVFHAPVGAGTKTHYRELTAADVLGWYAITGLPGITFKMHPGSKLIEAAALAVQYLGTVYAVGEAFNLFFASQPKPTRGHYYKTETWYSSNGKLNVRLTIWNSKAAFNNNDLPLYKNTTTYTFPGF